MKKIFKHNFLSWHHRTTTPPQYFKSLLVLLLIASFCFVGCGKEETNNTQLQENLEISIPRYINEGRLTFKSIEDLQKYYFALEAKIENAEDEELIFERYEKGYKSLRSKLESSKDNFYFNPNLKTDISTTDDFLLDDIRESLLNEYHEVGVGEDVFIYLSLKQLYKVSCEEDALKLRNMKKGLEPDFYFSKLSGNMELLTKNGIDDFKVNSSNIAEVDECGKRVEVSQEEEWEYELRGLVVGTPCNAFEIRFQTGVYEKWKDPQSINLSQWSIMPASYTIDFGDGTIENFPDQEADEVLVNHTYQETGLFTITVTVTYANSESENDEQLEQVFQVDIAEACAFGEFTDAQFVISSSTSKAMYAEIWFLDKILGTKAGAKTTGYEDEGNYNWAKEKGAITTFISSDFRDINCSNSNQKEETKDCNNCKSKQSQVTDWFNYMDLYDGSVFSEHEFVDGNANIQYSLVLNPCQ